MTTPNLIERVNKILHSSAYAPGDPLTFKVPFVEGVELPAPADPSIYMADVQAKLKFSLPPGGRICVVGGGFGGLAAYFLARGAKQVVVIEPRFRFFDGLDKIVALLDEIYSPEEPDTIKTFKAWPHPGHEASLGQFDLVICPEGFDECPTPVTALTALLKLVKPNGGLVMEVACGESTTVPPGPVNSWRPKVEVIADLIRKINNSNTLREAPARAPGRVLLATVPATPEVPEIKQVTFSEPMPRPIVKAPAVAQLVPPPPPPPAPEPVVEAKQVPEVVQAEGTAPSEEAAEVTMTWRSEDFAEEAPVKTTDSTPTYKKRKKNDSSGH